MRKIIGIGETILDIIFQNNQPFKAVPGGSTFNCMVSLGRCHLPGCFISEMGHDKIGYLIRDFMQENNLSTDYIDFFSNGNSPVALAFLDEQQNAEYVFYRDFPEKRLDVDFPEINENDILIFGSYFAVNEVLRERVQALLTYAKERNAIIYYDINFRKPHAHERLKLMVHFIENFEYSSIIRCSDEDLSVLYPGKTIDEVYRDHISFYCKTFIVTQGAKNILLKTRTFEKEYEVRSLTPVSTIGAGDNFNAGLTYGLMKYCISHHRIDQLEEWEWDQLIALAEDFSAEVCLSYDNFISNSFAKKYLV